MQTHVSGSSKIVSILYLHSLVSEALQFYSALGRVVSFFLGRGFPWYLLDNYLG